MTTMTTKTCKSPLNDYSNKIFELQKISGDNLDKILEYFRLDLRRLNKFYVGCCPIHSGDNESAFNIFHVGPIVGNWRCFTHHCEKHCSSAPDHWQEN